MDSYSSKLFGLLLVLSVAGLVFSTAEGARPLMDVLSSSSGRGGGGIEGLVRNGVNALVDGLALGAIKNSGPSPGVGH